MDNKNNLQTSPENTNDVENISKIRDILFGNNMNEYEKRFELLEEKLAKSVAENKQELDQKLSALDFFIKKELKSFGEQLTEEEEARERFDKKLLNNIEELEQTFKRFKQTTHENTSEDRQHFMEVTNGLGEQILSLKQSLQNRIDDNNNQLQTNKVDRSSLAIMLTDLAYQIAGENDTPKDKEQ